MAIRRVKIPTITTVGANGSAAATVYSGAPLVGRILALYIDFTNQPATTDVTITTNEAPVQTIYAKTDANTDGWFYPRVPMTDTAGAAVTYDGTHAIYESIPVCDILKVVVAQGDSNKTIDITVIYEE